MKNLIQYAPQWNEVWEAVLSRSSVFVHLPRNHGERQFIESIIDECQKDEFVVCVQISFSLYGRGGLKVDYAGLWQAIQQQLKIKSRAKVVDDLSFENAFTALLKQAPGDFIVIITGNGRGDEQLHCDMVTSFDRIRLNLSEGLKQHLSIVVLDDFSLQYFKKWDITSGWTNYKNIYFQHPTEEAIQEFICHVISGNHFDTQAIATNLYAITGGHIGLLLEAVEAHESHKINLGLLNWEAKLKSLLYNGSPVVESIRLRLEENPFGLTEKALRYKKSEKLSDSGDTETQFLRQIGVLQRVSLSRAILCKGIVSELVEEIHASSSKIRPLGTVIPDNGPKIYYSNAEDVVATDSDFVIVHLSDIHVGPYFPFKLTGIPDKKELLSITDCLIDDLKRLKLIGRIDALIISGDLTTTAQWEEYVAARELLKEIITQAQIDVKNVVLIAGNHDVNWKTNEFNRPESSGASRQNYTTFRELMTGKETDSLAELTTLNSRDGSRQLNILSLDTNYVEGPLAPGIGYIAPKAFDEGKRMINTLLANNSGVNGVDSATWIVVHHHVFPATSSKVPEALKRQISIIGNVSDLLSYASLWGAEMILHGHEHQPSITVARRWPSEQRRDFEPLISVGAGSFGAPRADLGPFSRNHYYIIIRRQADIIIRSRQLSMNGLAFEPHCDVSIPK